MSQIPARVAALAAQIKDEPLAWKEHADGSIVIVFNMKGKQTFQPVVAAVGADSLSALSNIIHTKEDAEEIIKTLPPKKKKEK